MIFFACYLSDDYFVNKAAHTAAHGHRNGTEPGFHHLP